MQSFKTQITLRGIAIENCFENIVKKSPGMATQLKIASKTVSTHMRICTIQDAILQKTNHLAWHRN